VQGRQPCQEDEAALFLGLISCDPHRAGRRSTDLLYALHHRSHDLAGFNRAYLRDFFSSREATDQKADHNSNVVFFFFLQS
jgi:hypothetical protein